MNNFIEEFKARGFFHQCTNIEELTKLTNESSITAYGGFDCTASSLHIGNLILIMILRLLQKHGHKPIVLVGGGTTKIGDPSGRDEVRKLLTDEALNHNIESLKTQLGRFIKFGKVANDAIMVNNDDWLKELNYIDFLKDYGCHFSVNRMLSFDSVKLRLEREQSLSFLEFNYMIFQAYDYTILNKKYNCRLQVGGSDQWGNIINGVELGRKLRLPELYGLTNPLLTKSSGEKMGKSVSGAVWLDKNMFSPYDYYQYWRNTEDADTIKFLKLFTELDLNEIEKLADLKGADINEAKKILAYEATKLCHGIDEAEKAEKMAKQSFEEKVIATDAETLLIDESELKMGISIIELLNRSRLCSSNGEAKRLIKGKGAKLNDIIIESETRLIDSSDLQSGIIKLSSGKKNYIVIKIK